MLARDLVHEPPNVLGPVEFAAEAAKLADLGVGRRDLERGTDRRLGMNCAARRGAGSARPARLVVMRWNGGAAGEPPVAFVGKGVVFDTGGISIKPAASMEDMKGDMGGAAAVTGLMHALATRKAKVNAVGVIGLVENMPDGNAMRPGDIVKAMSGTTIEIVNTDAEGRLVLADALWYAQDRFKPKFMIDLATLTGAISSRSATTTWPVRNNDELSANLLAAGFRRREALAAAALVGLRAMIESRFADIKNSAGRLAGSSTAAHFLQHFVNGVPWAHLDIAGRRSAAAPARPTSPGRRASALRCSTGWCATTTRGDARTAVPLRSRRALTLNVLGDMRHGLSVLYLGVAHHPGGLGYAGYLVVNATRAVTGRSRGCLCVEPGASDDDAWASGVPCRPGASRVRGHSPRLDEIAYNTRPLS